MHTYVLLYRKLDICKQFSSEASYTNFETTDRHHMFESSIYHVQGNSPPSNIFVYLYLTDIRGPFLSFLQVVICS